MVRKQANDSWWDVNNERKLVMVRKQANDSWWDVNNERKLGKCNLPVKTKVQGCTVISTVVLKQIRRVTNTYCVETVVCPCFPVIDLGQWIHFTSRIFSSLKFMPSFFFKLSQIMPQWYEQLEYGFGTVHCYARHPLCAIEILLKY